MSKPRVSALLAISIVACHQAPAGGPPRRVVTLTPSVTELVAEIAGLEALVGVDQFSTYPAAVTALPRVGDFLTTDQEAILRLHPDLVVADTTQRKAAEGLRQLGLRVIALPMHTIADVESAARQLGAALGREREGEAVASRIESAIDNADARHAALRVLIVMDRERGGLGNMIAAGPGSYLDEVVALLGAENVLSASGVRYPPISVETIVRARPQVILDVSRVADAADPTADWHSLAEVPAVAAGRVVVLSDAVFAGPGPRVDAALAELDAILTAVPPPAGSASAAASAP